MAVFIGLHCCHFLYQGEGLGGVYGSSRNSRKGIAPSISCNPIMTYALPAGLYLPLTPTSWRQLQITSSLPPLGHLYKTRPNWYFKLFWWCNVPLSKGLCFQRHARVSLGRCLFDDRASQRRILFSDSLGYGRTPWAMMIFQQISSPTGYDTITTHITPHGQWYSNATTYMISHRIWYNSNWCDTAWAMIGLQRI